jgi:hypothetical protein
MCKTTLGPIRVLNVLDSLVFFHNIIHLLGYVWWDQVSNKNNYPLILNFPIDEANFLFEERSSSSCLVMLCRWGFRGHDQSQINLLHL